MIEDFSKQNCKYLEIRSTPKAFANSSMKEYIEAIIEVFEHAERDFDIKVRFLASINRQFGAEPA